MKIIKTTTFENGSRPALQDWTNPALPDGHAWCSDEFAEVFYSTNPAGFVNITVENDTVTEMTVNQNALDAYIAEHPVTPDPNPGPTPDERLAALEAENKLLRAQTEALAEQNDFQEELIVELANIVYA